MTLEESDMTCHEGTCSSSRTSRAARKGSVVAGGHHTATAAAGLKERGSIAIDLSPHAGRRQVNGQGYGRARSTGSCGLVVEYGSQALHHIGTVLGPTTGAKGTVPLSV